MLRRWYFSWELCIQMATGREVASEEGHLATAIWEIRGTDALGSVRHGWQTQKQKHREELVERQMLVGVGGF